MDFNNLYRSYQIQAAESVLDGNESYFYRKICRWYSAKFHTPLITVETLPIDHILTNYYESTMEVIPYNDLFDLVIEDFLPEIQKENEESLEEFMKEMEEEQAEQLAKKAGIKPKISDKPDKPLKSGKTPKTITKLSNTLEKPQSLNHVDQSGEVEDLTPNIFTKFDDTEA